MQMFMSTALFYYLLVKQMSMLIIKTTSFCQGDLVYAITGNYPAQDFFGINERDGRISVIKNLKEDVARANQYTVSLLH